MFLATLLLNTGGSMNRRFFKTEAECRNWASTQYVPPGALCYWLEAFDPDTGFILWSQGLFNNAGRREGKGTLTENPPSLAGDRPPGVPTGG